MIRSRLFRRQFLIAAASVLACVLVGSALLTFTVNLLLNKQRWPEMPFPSLVLNLIERDPSGDFVAALKRIEALQDETDRFKLHLLDENGELLYPKDGTLQRVEHLPQQEHHAEPLMPPSPHGGFLGGPPGPGGGMFPHFMLTKLHTSPARYLVLDFGPPPPPPDGRWFMPLSFVTLIVTMLLGIGVAMMIIFRSLRGAALQADDVISQLRAGNLKARFPVERRDEIGAAMERFNSMADEIEKLVERLRITENSRNHLLQELTHDLRTPVASLRTILEGVFSSVDMKTDVAEMADLATKEVEYMGKLVEDLLLLAQLTEPKYKPAAGLVDILSILEEESEAVAASREGAIRIQTHFHTTQGLVYGDEHLFRRLIRNVLENAIAYSHQTVKVNVSPAENEGLRVVVSDDGAGFTPEMLSKFGERRDQRLFRKTHGGKLSLGLGSVIMKSVVSLHGGELKAYNGPGGGAVVEFVIPKGHGAGALGDFESIRVREQVLKG